MPHLMSIQMMARLPILMANSNVVLMITIHHKVMHMAKLVPIKAKEQAKHQEAHQSPLGVQQNVGPVKAPEPSQPAPSIATRQYAA